MIDEYDFVVTCRKGVYPNYRAEALYRFATGQQLEDICDRLGIDYTSEPIKNVCRLISYKVDCQELAGIVIEAWENSDEFLDWLHTERHKHGCELDAWLKASAERE